MVWISVCIVLDAGRLAGQDAGTAEQSTSQISPEEFRAELARAQSDIELLRRALRRKQDAEKLAMGSRESLRAAEVKLDRLRQESSNELAKRAERIGVLEARVKETTRQLEKQETPFSSRDVEKLKGELDANSAAAAKFWVTERQCEVIDTCLQFFGGYGYMDEYPISRMYTDARVQRIYGGSNEIMRMLVARSL